MSESDDPDIYYIDAGPGEANYYNPVTNAIILDEKLKDYPLAHSRVLSHEFGHHKARHSPLQDLWHELQNDIELAFSTRDAIEQFREYEQATDPDFTDMRAMFSGYLINLFRGIWQPFIYGAGWVYRRLNARQ